MIECAFEGFHLSSSDESRGAVVFGRKFDGRAECARGICENIIANDGEFEVDPVSEDDWEDDDDDYDEDDEDEFDEEDDDDWEDEEDGLLDDFDPDAMSASKFTGTPKD